MKKSVFAIFLILLTVFVSGKLHSTAIRKISEDSIEALNVISENLSRRDYATAHSEFNSYKSGWNKKRKVLLVLMAHDEIDLITKKNARLSACLNDEAETEAFATIGELYEEFTELKQKFNVSLKNILQIRSLLYESNYSFRFRR